MKLSHSTVKLAFVASTLPLIPKHGIFNCTYKLLLQSSCVEHEKQALTWDVTNLQKYTNHKTSVLQTAHFIKEVIFLVVFSLVSCNKESNNKQTLDFPETLLISPLCPLTSNTFSHFLLCRAHIHTPVCTHTGVHRQTKSILAARKMPCMRLQITEG